MKINMNIVNEKTLKHLGACHYGIVWFLDKYKQIDVSEINVLEKDENGYVEWLIDKFINSTYDEKGNQLTYKSSDGFSWVSTYDEKGN